MQIQSSKQFNDVRFLYCLSDKLSLYFFGMTTDLMIVCFDPESFEKMNAFQVNTSIQPDLKPSIDEGAIYIPTGFGEVLCFDKLSGDLLATMDVGTMLVVSDIYHDDQNVYSLCAIPLSANGEIRKDNYSICINDKNTGGKISQSQSVSKLPIFMNVKDKIIVLSGRKLMSFNKMGLLQRQTNVVFPTAYKPVLTKNHVSCFSNIGTVEIFDLHDLSLTTRLQIGKTEYPPVSQRETIFHLTENSLETISLSEGKINHSHMLKHKPSCSLTCDENVVYGGTTNGYIFKYDIKTRRSEYLKTGANSIISLELIEEYLFAVSNNTIHQIRVA